MAAVAALAIAATGAEAAYKTIHPMAFAPDSAVSGSTPDFNNAWYSGELMGQGCYNAGVDLPDGARINKLKIYFKSTDQSHIVVTFYATKISNGETKTITFDFIEDDDDVRKFKNYVVSHTVNMSKFMYGIGVCPFSGGAFYGARIKYNPK